MATVVTTRKMAVGHHRRDLAEYRVVVELYEGSGFVKPPSELPNVYLKVSFQGQTAFTPTRYGATEVAWNKHIMFRKVVLALDEFRRSCILVEAYSEATFGRDEFLGSYTFDASDVYSQRVHRSQIRNQTVTLTHPTTGGFNGRVRLTITVLSSADGSVTSPAPLSSQEIEATVLSPLITDVPDGKEEDDDEVMLIRPMTRAVDAPAGYDVTVVVNNGRELPTVNGSDPNTFVLVRLGRTYVRSGVEHSTRSPAWATRLHLPLWLPSSADRVNVEVWHTAWGQPDLLLGTTQFSLQHVLRRSRGNYWACMYGPPTQDESFTSKVADMLPASLGGQSGKPRASHYRGRVYMGVATARVTQPVKQKEAAPPTLVPEPPVVSSLVVRVLRTRDVPLGAFGKVMAEVVWGPHKEQTPWFTRKGALVYFHDAGNPASLCTSAFVDSSLPQFNAAEPEYLQEQIWDAVVNLYTSTPGIGVRHIGLVRISAADIAAEARSYVAPRWYNIVPAFRPADRRVDHPIVKEAVGQVLLQARLLQADKLDGDGDQEGAAADLARRQQTQLLTTIPRPPFLKPAGGKASGRPPLRLAVIAYQGRQLPVVPDEFLPYSRTAMADAPPASEHGLRLVVSASEGRAVAPVSKPSTVFTPAPLWYHATVMEVPVAGDLDPAAPIMSYPLPMDLTIAVTMHGKPLAATVPSCLRQTQRPVWVPLHMADDTRQAAGELLLWLSYDGVVVNQLEAAATAAARGWDLSPEAAAGAGAHDDADAAGGAYRGPEDAGSDAEDGKDPDGGAPPTDATPSEVGDYGGGGAGGEGVVGYSEFTAAKLARRLLRWVPPLKPYVLSFDLVGVRDLAFTPGGGFDPAMSWRVELILPDILSVLLSQARAKAVPGGTVDPARIGSGGDDRDGGGVEEGKEEVGEEVGEGDEDATVLSYDTGAGTTTFSGSIVDTATLGDVGTVLVEERKAAAVFFLPGFNEAPDQAADVQPMRCLVSADVEAKQPVGLSDADAAPQLLSTNPALCSDLQFRRYVWLPSLPSLCPDAYVRVSKRGGNPIPGRRTMPDGFQMVGVGSLRLGDIVSTPAPIKSDGAVNFFGIFLTPSSRDALYNAFKGFDQETSADKVVLAVHAPEEHLQSLHAGLGSSVLLRVVTHASSAAVSVVGVAVEGDAPPPPTQGEGESGSEGEEYSEYGDAESKADDGSLAPGVLSPAEVADALLQQQPHPHCIVSEAHGADSQAVDDAFTAFSQPVADGMVLKGRLGASIRVASERSARVSFDAAVVSSLVSMRFTGNEEDANELVEHMGGPWAAVESPSEMDASHGDADVVHAREVAKRKEAEFKERFGLIAGGVTQAVHNFRVRVLQSPSVYGHLAVVPRSSMSKAMPVGELGGGGIMPGDGLVGPLSRLNARLLTRIDYDGGHDLRTDGDDAAGEPQAATATVAGSWDLEPLLLSRRRMEAGEGFGKDTKVPRATPGAPWTVFERYNAPLEATPWLASSRVRDMLLGAPRGTTTQEVIDSIVSGEAFSSSLNSLPPGREVPGWEASGGLKALLHVHPVRNTGAFNPGPPPRKVLPFSHGYARYLEDEYVELEVVVQVRRGFNITANGREVKPYLRMKVVGTGMQGTEVDGVLARLNDSEGPTSRPLFNKETVLEAIVPGRHELVVDVMCDGMLGLGEPMVLGTTRVDLERRWRDATWAELQKRNFVPVEVRTLFNEAGIPNGNLEMYVVMAKKGVPYPRRQLPAPESGTNLVWELRVVLWSVFGFAAAAPFYVKGFVVYGEDDPVTQATEVNEGETLGKSSEVQVNWRLKFPVRMGQDAPPVTPRLVLQVLRDTWFFSTDPPVAEAVLDLALYVARARETQLNQEMPPAMFSMTPRGKGGQHGRVRIQASLVSGSHASSNPVGEGRKEPNVDPFIPEPEGLGTLSRLLRKIVRFFKRFGVILTVLIGGLVVYLIMQ